MKKIIPLILMAMMALFLLITHLFRADGVTYAALPPDHPPIPNSSSDLFLPGTQPGQLVDPIAAPNTCRACHEEYSDGLEQPAEYEPWTSWQGSMMAQAGRDPVFYAALDIANADIPGGGEFCVRCHLPTAWLHGDPDNPPIDASEATFADLEGIQCELCHRMVDPVYTAENPDRDELILAEIIPAMSNIGSGALIIDPEAHRRGPFDIVADMPHNLDPHLAAGAKETLYSPYHREALLCASCHDISNPLLSWDEETGSYQPNDPNMPAPADDDLFPIERTFSEWLLSAYNSETGVYAPQFGGNQVYVSTCQDCHMRAVTGVGGSLFGEPVEIVRDDLPLHDLTGANTWVPQIIPLHPEFGQLFEDDPNRLAALEMGIERARYMLQNAATVTAVQQGNQLIVTVVNESGHKLPSGYVEGRRMWLQVEGFNSNDELVFSSGAYDMTTAELDMSNDPKIYESKHGLTADWAAEHGLLPGPSFHFILNNLIVSDNRIPPRGYNFAAFNAAGAAPYTDGTPDSTRYADGQYWDVTYYTLPDDVAYGRVRLLHQVASKEYIEFLRDNNPNVDDENNNGQILYNLWEMSGRSAPEVMAEVSFPNYHLYLPFTQK